MTYIVLLRKINVGKENRIEKHKLIELFADLGYADVEAYINSGNVIIKTTKSKNTIKQEIDNALYGCFNERIMFLVKTAGEMKAISEAIPSGWENDETQKTDIAYLSGEVDDENVISRIPFKSEYVTIKYVKGALIWNVKRENQGKSQLTKLVSQEIYQYMTLRNVNTARYLGSIIA